MLKKKITYKDFNDEEATEEFYFNVSRTELIEIEVGHDEGFMEFINRVIKTDDKKTLIAEFQRLILLAYGQKSLDGKRFIKNEELRTEFSQTAAYDALFMELATNENSAAEFVIGVLPKDMGKELERQQGTPEIVGSRTNIPRPPS